jgi:hypothetical protein
MARKSKKTNSEVDETLTIQPENAADEVIGAEEGDEITYTMGNIQVDEGSEAAEAEEFKKASDSLQTKEEGDEEGEWIQEEDFSLADEDPFLDAADFDSDNPDNDEY